MSPLEIIERSIIIDFDFNSLRAVGSKTIKELALFKKQVLTLLENLHEQEFTRSDLVLETISRTLMMNLKDDQILKGLIQSKELNILQFIDQYLSTIC